MHHTKNANIYSIVTSNKTEEKLLEVILGLLTNASDEEIDHAVRMFQSVSKTCPSEIQVGDTIQSCGLPEGHQGKRHVQFIIWDQ